MSTNSRASVASMARYWSSESFADLNNDDVVALRFTLERAADLLSEPLRWEDVAEEALGVMKAAADVAAKKAADDIYQRILESSMDYLENNIRFNIASTLETAERGRNEAQARAAEERAARLDLQNLAADECARADLMRSLLTRAREYVFDALDGYEHSDGRELLTEIDAVLFKEQGQ